MRTVQMEYLRPEELVEERERCSIVYLPVGPLEWHGPAMPLGTDPLMAQELARRAALCTGGVVMPTVFFGTERDRPTGILAAKGFPDAKNMYVLGMDVPKNCYKSFYAREEIFALTIREYLRLLVQEEYKLIVIVNGHGAWGQKGSLERLAIQFSHETPSRVIALMPDVMLAGEEADFGHGTKIETSLIRYLFDEDVDLSALPPRGVPIKYTDYGIADDFIFSCKRSPNDAVVYDPRDATPELGKKMFDVNLAKLCETVQETYKSITQKNGGK